MFDLHNKVAVVTGAGQGMGRAHALALLGQGATVVITDLDMARSEAVVEEAKAQGLSSEAVALAMDVSKVESINAAFDTIIARFGRVDILVNNAGIYESVSALDITETQWDKMIDINLKGQFFCAQRAAKEMMKHNWGRIINISSISSGGVGVGVSGASHYTASKGGVIGMTEVLATELAPYGILVNAVAPGGIDTPMANPEGKPADELQSMMAHTPLKRIGRPEEVSAAVVFLASMEASYITGTTLYVDGGWLAA